MKRLLIRVKEYLLKVEVTKNNTTIFDSYQVKTPSDMKLVIKEIRNFVEDNDYTINSRSITSMLREWRSHNLLYSLGLFRSRVKDVDLNTVHQWWLKTLYFIVSLFYPYYK